MTPSPPSGRISSRPRRTTYSTKSPLLGGGTPPWPPASWWWRAWASARSAWGSWTAWAASGSNTTGAADGAAPESSGETTSDTAGGDDTGDTGDTGDAGAAETTFGATVLEVHDGWLLVEPLEGEDILASADRFMVSLADVEEIPDLEAGDEVAVTSTV